MRRLHGFYITVSNRYALPLEAGGSVGSGRISAGGSSGRAAARRAGAARIALGRGARSADLRSAGRVHHNDFAAARRVDDSRAVGRREARAVVVIRRNSRRGNP